MTYLTNYNWMKKPYQDSKENHHPTTPSLFKRTVTNILKSFLLLMSVILVGQTVWGQSSITEIGTPVTQNFDGLSSAGTWIDNSTLQGWYARTDATFPITAFDLNDGTTNEPGALYSFGIVGVNNSSDKAFGFVPSNVFTGSEGSGKGYIGWRLKNNSDKTIGTIKVKWTGEQWRQESLLSPEYIILKYQIGNSITDLNSGIYLAANSQFASPINVVGAGAPLDGNDPANRLADITVELNVNLAPGQEIMLRWEDLNDKEINNLLAIDDVSVTATKKAQTITFGALTPQNYVNLATFELAGTADSSLPVTYSTSNPSVITISGTTATIHGAGVATITASQAGDAAYAPSTDISQDQVVIPIAPVAIAATSITTGSFKANWNASDGGASQYWIYYSIDNFATQFTPINTYNQNYILIIGLKANTTYYYKIKARARIGYDSDFSNLITVVTTSGIQTNNIIQTASGFSSSTLSWTNGNESNRIVFLKEGTGTCPNPVDNINYNASSNWISKSSQLGSSDFYCISKGTGSTVSLTNLNPGLTYTVAAFEYNGSSTTSVFLTTTGVNNPITFSTWGTTTFTNSIGVSTPEVWNTAARWDHGTIPSATLNSSVKVYIDGNCVVADDQVSNNLTINAAHDGIRPKLTISNSGTFTVKNNTELGSDTCLVIKSSSATQIGTYFYNTFSGNGSVKVERFMSKDDYWHLYCSPVSNQTVHNFLLNNLEIPELGDHSVAMTNYITTSDKWNSYFIYANGNTDNLPELMGGGKGFTIRTIHNYNDNGTIIEGTGTIDARGTPNAFPVTATLTANGWNCIGNPFTSALDVAAFLSSNSTLINQSFAFLYLWDPNKLGTGIGGYSTISAGNVPTGQGFFIKSSGTSGSASFTETMMKSNTGLTFKSAESEFPLIRISVSNKNLKSSTEVNFIANATKGLDPGYDAGMFKTNPDFALYSNLLEDNGVDFQTQSLPDQNYDQYVIPIGLDFKAGGDISFSGEAINLPAGCQAMLEDRLTKRFTRLDLKDAKYVAFVSANTKGNGRFFLHTSDVISSVQPIEKEPFKVNAVGTTVYINGEVSEKANFFVYSVNGKQLANFKAESQVQNQFDASGLPAGVYILTCDDQNQKKSTKFVIEN